MTTSGYSAEVIPGLAPRRQSLGRTIIKWVTSTDHKTIGYMYLITSVIWFCVGGVLALAIRAELFEPGIQIVQSKEQYNQLFTMHGTIMLLLFATCATSCPPTLTSTTPGAWATSPVRKCTSTKPSWTRP